MRLCRRARRPHRLDSRRSRLLLWSTGGSTVKHALDTQVFVDVGPMHTLTITDDFVIVTLSRRRLTQSPRPYQRNADDSPVDKMKCDQIIRGFKSELTGHSFPANMNVRRFIAIEAIEIDAVRSRDVLDSRHSVHSTAVLYSTNLFSATQFQESGPTA